MTQLQDQYEMSQADVAEKIYLTKTTVGVIEKRAMEKIRKLLEERGISADDLFNY